MFYNKTVIITSAPSRTSKNWIGEELLWSEFVEKIKVPVRSNENFEDYMKLSKADRDNLKDVGGYVGGELSGPERNAKTCISRDIVTLDYDNISTVKLQILEENLEKLNCAAIIHSTRKHQPRSPRVRVIIPLARIVTPDEYGALSRIVAMCLDIDDVDPTTFEPSRLMFWPSVCRDAEYYIKSWDRPFLSADAMLATLEDWHDVSSWPRVPGEDQIRDTALQKQQDPTTKGGPVGAFCRAYRIPDVIDAYLSDVYQPSETIEGRYTYIKGSTNDGAVVYDGGKFLYSYHATDPASGKLLNSFDLVRIHKFSGLDEKTPEDTPTTRLPSYDAMIAECLKDGKVKTELVETKISAADVFKEKRNAEAGNDSDWMQLLEFNKTGEITRKSSNIVIILENDPLLKGTAAYDQFHEQFITLRPLPWGSQEPGVRAWTDADDSNLRNYLGETYNIISKDQVRDATIVVAHKHPYHEVRDYLKSLSWDGKPRLGSLLIDYLGAPDNKYVKTATIKFFMAAVRRCIRDNPDGVKFDNMLVLVGKQGIGKSTLLDIMGGKWFSDAITCFKGKEAAEQMRGVWIMEVAEMSAYSYSDVSDVKQFVSRKIDQYRPPYGTHVQKFVRQGVLAGTSNKRDFLKDTTGNRRFWPIDCSGEATKSVWEDLPKERDQIWAEAVAWEISDNDLFLTPELESIARGVQEDHMLPDPAREMIQDFLLRLVPYNWDSYSISQRKIYWGNWDKRECDRQKGLEGPELLQCIKEVPRTKVCAAEVFCELYDMDRNRMTRRDALQINDALESMPEWRRISTPLRFGPYGNQRGFTAVLNKIALQIDPK